MERDFKGVWIPAEIYLIRELSWAEKILFIEIYNNDNDGEGCDLLNRYFANFLNVTQKQISTYLKKLSDLGFIEVLIIRNEFGTFRKIYVTY